MVKVADDELLAIRVEQHKIYQQNQNKNEQRGQGGAPHFIKFTSGQQSLIPRYKKIPRMQTRTIYKKILRT